MGSRKMAVATEESLKLILHRGVSFCDAVLYSDKNELLQSQRWLYSKHRFKNHVEKLIGEQRGKLREVVLLDEFADRLSGLRIGGSVAPVFPRGLEKLTSQTQSSPIHSESLILVEPPLWTESWKTETLAQLKENSIKRISWHCQVPDEILNFFQENGYENFKLNKTALFDLNHWRSNLLNASCSGPVLELTEEIQTVLKNIQCEAQVLWLDEDLQTRSQTQNRYGLTSTWTHLVYLWAQKQFPKTSDIFVFDWDGCFRICASQNARWTPWGPIASLQSVPHVELFELQPTQTLGKNILGEWNWTGKADQFEPGPVFLGRGLRPTVLDLICHEDWLKKTFEVKEGWAEKLDRQMASHCGLKSMSTLDEIKKDLKKKALQHWAREAFVKAQSDEILLLGPFAELIAPFLDGARFRKLHVCNELPNLFQLRGVTPW